MKVISRLLMKTLSSTLMLLLLFFIVKLHTHLVGLELMKSPFTLLLQGKEVPFELELIGTTLMLLITQAAQGYSVMDKLLTGW